MIVLLIAASLAAHSDGAPRRIGKPCQAVPALCLSGEGADHPRLSRSVAPTGDAKMAAYRFDARPCRIVGNMDCPKRANRQIFRLGEPIEQTLARSFGLD